MRPEDDRADSLHSSHPESDTDSIESATDDDPHPQSVGSEAINGDTLPGAYSPGQPSKSLGGSPVGGGSHGGLSAAAVGDPVSSGFGLDSETGALEHESAGHPVVATLSDQPGSGGTGALPLEALANATSHQPLPEGE